MACPLTARVATGAARSLSARHMLPCALSTRAMLHAVAGVIATGGGAGGLCVGLCVGCLGGSVHGRWVMVGGGGSSVASGRLGVRGGVGMIGGVSFLKILADVLGERRRVR